jgi:hypothetical protein
MTVFSKESVKSRCFSIFIGIFEIIAVRKFMIREKKGARQAADFTDTGSALCFPPYLLGGSGYKKGGLHREGRPGY